MRTISLACSSSHAVRSAGGASWTRNSCTVVASRTEPMNCRMTPTPPTRETVPRCGVSSPAIMRSSVVLPAPFAPTSAALTPSPTRKATSLSSSRPSGRTCPTPATSTYPMPHSLAARDGPRHPSFEWGHNPPMRELAELVADLPPDTVITDPDVVAGYRQDWARDPDAGTPLAVVRVASTADVQATLRWASRHGVSVVPRGAGSSLSGGSTAVDGAITLSTERMRAVTVDPVTRVAVTQPGAFNAQVKAAAAAHDLWYPPDPSSFEICSIGGNAATNAGGLCCVKYGVTTDYVLGMEVVLADGTAVRLGGPRLKDVAGLSLLKLFVGSEGTLGVITELTLRLLPAPPPACTLVATFPSVEASAMAVVAITSTLRPSMLELMDNGAINAVEDLVKMGLDRVAGALLLARSDAPGGAAAIEIDQIRA